VFDGSALFERKTLNPEDLATQSYKAMYSIYSKEEVALVGDHICNQLVLLKGRADRCTVSFGVQ